MATKKQAPSDLRDLIDKALEARACNQGELAKELGIPAQTVSRMRGSLDWQEHYQIITKLQVLAESRNGKAV